MIWSVAWRNIWRNKVRSRVIVAAITVGIFAGVFIWAFYRGMVEQRIQSAIITESSHIQMHHKRYLVNPDQTFIVKNTDSVELDLKKIPQIKAYSCRVLVNAMIASAETGSGVRVVGVDTFAEKQVTNLYEKVVEGTYLGSKKTPVLIGEKLAEKLSVNLRSRLVLTLQTMDGTLTSGLFRVAGIYRTSNSMYDEANIFVRRSDLNALINIDSNACHEIAILLHDNSQLTSAAETVEAAFPDSDIKTWRQLMPEVSFVEETMDVYMYFFLGVILAALIFGIINTMLMAVLERTRELGMLMAVGMNKLRVFFMIMLETILLSITGGFAGIISAYFVVLFFNSKGIDLSVFAEGVEKFGYEAIVYPVPHFDITVKVVVMVIITGILAALYPAWRAVRLNPAAAIHIDN